MLRNRWWQSVCLLCLLLLSTAQFGCSTNPVTGKQQLSFMSEDQEVAIGRKTDPQIVTQFGEYQDPALIAYVNKIGQSMARLSHRPDLNFTFRVLDSPVVNAFALPGGYVYFTRGILAHFNSEAELAGVIGHEIGHITARHGADRYTKLQLASLGLGLGGIVLPRKSLVNSAAQNLVGLALLSYGRDDESQSDELGVESSAKAGYDAREMARFFETIDRISKKSGGGVPTFLSTHPNPSNRQQRIQEMAEAWKQKYPNATGGSDRAAYLERIAGIVYGEDPQQGFVQDGHFYHPALRFQFRTPTGWKVANTPSQVQMVNSNGTAAIQFSLGKDSSALASAAEFSRATQAAFRSRSQIRVHGMPGVSQISDLRSQQGGTIRVLSYFIEKDAQVYVFHGFTAANNFSRQEPTFERTMRSFDQLTNRALLNRQPKRIRVETARQGGNLQTVLQRLGADPADLEDLAILNGMRHTDTIRAGQLIKVAK